MLLGFLGAALVLLTLYDVFETIVLPGSVERRFNLTRGFYEVILGLIRKILKPLRARAQESLLGALGPASLIFLIAIWAWFLIIGFAFMHYGFDVPMKGVLAATLPEYIYMSAVTFFTLGYGDLVPETGFGRALVTIEAGTGFGMLAIVISYLPVIYQAFSHRESVTVLLDARAGSPPSATELLCRLGDADSIPVLNRTLQDFETWAARLLESYISYSMMALYRSQHEKLSWLTSSICILDTCALIEVSCRDNERLRPVRTQAKLTFAMVRHLLVDLSYLIDVPPQKEPSVRLTPADFQQVRARLAEAELHLNDDFRRLQVLREEYEPFALGLAKSLYLIVPAWIPPSEVSDSWQTTAWDAERHF